MRNAVRKGAGSGDQEGLLAALMDPLPSLPGRGTQGSDLLRLVGKRGSLAVGDVHKAGWWRAVDVMPAAATMKHLSAGLHQRRKPATRLRGIAGFLVLHGRSGGHRRGQGFSVHLAVVIEAKLH